MSQKIEKLKRLLKTLRLCYKVFVARTYGEYLHTVHTTVADECYEYALYRYRGEHYSIPSVSVINRSMKNGG